MFLSLCFWLVYQGAPQRQIAPKQAILASILKPGMTLQQAEKSLSLWAERPILSDHDFTMAYLSHRYPRQVIVLQCLPDLGGNWHVIQWRTRAQLPGEQFYSSAQRGADISKLLHEGMPLDQAEKVLGVWAYQSTITSGSMHTPFLCRRYPGLVVWLTYTFARGTAKSTVMQWSIEPQAFGPVYPEENAGATISFFDK